MEPEPRGAAAALLRQKRAALRRRGCSFESPSSVSEDLGCRRGDFSRKHYGSVELLISSDADGAIQRAGRFRVENGSSDENATALPGTWRRTDVHLENPEYHTRWYFKYFLGQVHQNYIGNDAEKSPFFLSVTLSDQNNQRVPQYRAILWRKTGTQKICLPYSPTKTLSVKSILSAMNLDKFEKGPREIFHPEIQKDLLVLEEQEVPGDSEKRWRPALVVLTEKDLLIYDSMPRRKEAWFSPVHTYPLLATRLVHSGPGKGSPQAGMDLSFATRTGTQQGIETHLFRAEVSRDLSHWTRSIVQACHDSAELAVEISTACTYKNQECRLTIHYENGFSVTTEPQDGAFPKTVIQAPYEKLKTSSDDGIRMLHLDFGGKDGELQLDLHSCPKPIVFIIHSFLSAKITRLGLVA